MNLFIIKKSNYFLFTFLLMTIASCSNQSSSQKNNETKQVVPDDVSEYAKASCLYQFQDGPAATPLSSSLVVSSYFDKRFDNNLLSPVLAASAAEVVRFAQLTGVQYFKTKAYKQGSCEFAANLPEAPQDLNAKFNKFNTDDSILGLYLPKNSQDVPTTSVTAAITVRSDSNKWVFVHEYMHHLFQIQNVTDNGGVAVDIREKYLKDFADFQAAANNLNKLSAEDQLKGFQELAQRLKTLNLSFVAFLKEFYLEEMTIETTLGEKLDRDELRYVIAAQRINGAAYTLSSGKKTKELIEEMSKMNSSVLPLFSPYLSEEEKAAVSASANFNNILAHIETLSDRARSLLKSKGLIYKEMRQVSKLDFHEGNSQQINDDHTGCWREKIADDTVKDLFKNINKLKF